MKLKHNFFLIIVLSLFHQLCIEISFAQTYAKCDINCFSIIVGKKATVDGAVLFAHNEDDGSPQLVNYYRVPRLEHKAGETIILQNGAVIPQVKVTYGYLWFEMVGLEFSDSYINEWGVAIVSDGCPSRETNPEFVESGIKYWLRRLVVERARTAREGVRIAGEIIRQVGYASSGRTYVIADPSEGWMLAVVQGKHWVAQRVPDDKAAVIPNYYTIGEIDLADTTNFLGSPDIIDYAIQQGWYEKKRDGVFHFAKVYSNPDNLKSPDNVPRMWRGVNLLAGESYKIDDEFPFAFIPKKKLAVQDIMLVLRDHYEGTELDKTHGYKSGNPHFMNGSTICSEITQNSFVAQLRNWLPVEIGAVIWLSQRRPDSQPYVPWYLGINKIPDGYAFGDYDSALKQHFTPREDIYDMTRKHAFWAFVMLAEKVDEDYGKKIGRIRKKWDAIEKETFGIQAGFEKKVLSIYKNDPLKAKAALTKFTAERAAEVWQISKQLVKE